MNELRQYLKEHDLSYQTIATKTGRHYNYICNLLNGSRSMGYRPYLQLIKAFPELKPFLNPPTSARPLTPSQRYFKENGIGIEEIAEKMGYVREYIWALLSGSLPMRQSPYNRFVNAFPGIEPFLPLPLTKKPSTNGRKPTIQPQIKDAYIEQQDIAGGYMAYALKTGQLIRPAACELCGRKCKPHGHHWNGYNNPLDVWWICQPCNCRLFGPEFHCGQVTKAEARAITIQPSSRELYAIARANGKLGSIKTSPVFVQMGAQLIVRNRNGNGNRRARAR